jgi:hypothetical protein
MPPSNLLPPHLHTASLSWVRTKTEPRRAPCHFPHLTESHCGPERPLGQAPGSSMAGYGGWSTIDHALHWSTACGPSPPHFSLQNKSPDGKCPPLCKEPHVLVENQAAVH